MRRPEGTDMLEPAAYMAHTELIKIGPMDFDDLKNYRSWRSSFKSVVQNLSIPQMVRN